MHDSTRQAKTEKVFTNSKGVFLSKNKDEWALLAKLKTSSDHIWPASHMLCLPELKEQQIIIISQYPFAKKIIPLKRKKRKHLHSTNEASFVSSRIIDSIFSRNRSDFHCKLIPLRPFSHLKLCHLILERHNYNAELNLAVLLIILTKER